MCSSDLCNALGCAEVTHDARFKPSDRRSPDPNNKQKSMRAGGVQFPALHAIIQARLEALSVPDLKRLVKRLDKAGVPVDIS